MNATCSHPQVQAVRVCSARVNVLDPELVFLESDEEELEGKGGVEDSQWDRTEGVPSGEPCRLPLQPALPPTPDTISHGA